MMIMKKSLNILNQSKLLSLANKSLCTGFAYNFSNPNHKQISKQRQQMIRNHPPLTQYANFQPITTEHKKNSVRIINDKETNLTFLIEEGGFPGCSDLGIGIKVGTQDQDATNAGSLMCLKNFVHMKSSFDQIIKNYQFLHQTGSSFDFNYDVLNSYAKCSFFEQDFQVMINLLLDLALKQKKMFEDNIETCPDQSNIVQLVRRAAFNNSGIGMPSTGLGNTLTNSQFVCFQQKITPHNTIISLSNLSNPQQYVSLIKQKIKQNYTEFLKRQPIKSPESVYKGGLVKFQDQEQDYFQFAVVLPSVDYKDRRMELYNILRVLLGTASSFSSGGPGKGMHSRCTKNLMNKIACIENASFINQHFVGHGLFGLTAGGTQQQAHQVISSTMNEFKRLQYLIPEEQLNRAKNILSASVYANVQRQGDRLQEMTKHLYCYGKVRLNEYEQNIRAVTNTDIKRQMERIFALKPTFVARGNRQALKVVKDQQYYEKLLRSKQ